MNKTIADIFAQEDLERSVLIGYYGGGNFGDELLLEVLMNLFTSHGVKSLTVTYQHLERYSTYHHEFGYKRIDMADKKSVFKAILKNKNIVIGGGGLWGLDVNPNIFVLSCLLFFSRFLLRKRVYLLGVGYYNSTNFLGQVSAALAGSAANIIVARDNETQANFLKIQKRTYLDVDIAWSLKHMSLDKTYDVDVQKLEKQIIVKKRTLFISLRRFRAGQNSTYVARITKLLTESQSRPIVIVILEPAIVDPKNYGLLQTWQQTYPNVQIIDFSYNPLALLLFFRHHRNELAIIGPQFHLIITAEIAGIPFLPISYDNKVKLLIEQLGHTAIPISELTHSTLKHFAKEQLLNI